tara:strand:+ start:1224 stop:1325 length:102 start_codon:yes stop_codon:yes gene_type:complete
MIEIIGYIFGMGFLIWLTVLIGIYIAIRIFENL